MAAMTEAVLFDLFGTLIDSGSTEQRDSVSRAVAAELAVDIDAFTSLVQLTFDERVKGQLGGLTETYADLARRVGGSPDSQQVERAVRLRLDLSRKLLGDEGAARILGQLRTCGFRLGVVSDYSAETPTVWESTWLSRTVAAVSFSCELGIRKPDPEMYLHLTRTLGVSPDQCMYVGDGGSRELSGARALGMKTILLCDPREEGRERPDEDLNWDRDRIRSLAEILPCLGIATTGP
jgi:putative hydrolase of the HAD superfamily